MKKEDLFDMIGDIDNQYIQEAHMDDKPKNNFIWAKWGTVAACFALVMITTAIANHLTSITDENLSQFESSQSANFNNVEAVASGKEESSTIKDVGNLKENMGMNDTYTYPIEEMDMQEDNSMESSKNDGKDVPADDNGEYYEVVDENAVCNRAPEFFGGCYLDEDGTFVIVLTEDTPQNREDVCKAFGKDEDSTKFVMGTYTLVYLTELQEKITNAMINGELSFVVSSGVYETINCIVVNVTTTDETELEKLYALDTLGGAIQVGVSSGATTDVLVELKPE